MKIRRNALALYLLVASGWLPGLTAVRAETFTLDATQSVLTISATFAGFDIEPQESGSLRTTYTGTIEADVTSSSIMFVGGSLIAARDNGTWQPGPGGAAGSAPANFGGQVVNLLVNGKAALRNVLMDVTSDVVPVSGGPGTHYTILGSTNLVDWPVVIDQFAATNQVTERTVALPAALPQQYFRVRQD